MPITFGRAAQAKEGASGTSSPIAVTVTINAGETAAAVIVQSSTTPGSVTGITGGGTWTQRAAITNGNVRTEIWSTDAGASVAATSISVAWSGSNDGVQVEAACYPGVSTIGVTNTATGATSNPSITLTTHDGNDFVVGGFGFSDGTVATPTPTALTGNLRVADHNSVSGAFDSAAALTDNTSASPGSVANAVTFSASAGTKWAAVALELRAAAAGFSRWQREDGGFWLREDSGYWLREESTGTGSTLLVLADSSVGLGAEAPSLTQANTLAVNDARSLLAVDAPSLTQQNTLAVADAQSALGAESPTLSVGAISLTPADAAVGLTADSPALIQANVLAVADARSLLGAESPTLVQQNTLAPADAMSLLAADSPSLTQANVLAAQDATVHLAAENVTLGSAGQLGVQDALSASTADVPALTQANVLAAQDGAAVTRADAVALDFQAMLDLAEVRIALGIESPVLAQANTLSPDEALIAAIFDSPNITAQGPGGNTAFDGELAVGPLFTGSLAASPLFAGEMVAGSRFEGALSAGPRFDGVLVVEPLLEGALMLEPA